MNSRALSHDGLQESKTDVQKEKLIVFIISKKYKRRFEQMNFVLIIELRCSMFFYDIVRQDNNKIATCMMCIPLE
jgi:hypothetical protein